MNEQHADSAAAGVSRSAWQSGAAIRLRCRCVWNGERCPNEATQEDQLCDWCGPRRMEDLADNPNLVRDPLTDEILGLGGRGERHVDPSVTPDACWMPGSGRCMATEDRCDEGGASDG